jgi:cytochrome c
MSNIYKYGVFMQARLLVSSVLALTALLGAGSAMADMKLAQEKNCMACHAVDKKMVGPSYKDVAAKYAGQGDAVDKLSQKVIKGGSGVWGPVPMPANGQVNDADAKKLVAWILAAK